ncbi:MAG TPA: response regulator [Croceibacterium sp.]|jgi:two-component system phosphate regulon response regulator PhoB
MAFVLVIEANKTVAGRASDAINAAGHACGWVLAAGQAVTLLRWRAADLILLDQGLPGADGGALPQTLRRAAGVSDLPIVLLTSRPVAEPHDRSIVDYIEKPFDPRYLVWRVNHALETRPRRRLSLDDIRDDDPPYLAGTAPAPLRTVA